MNEAGSRRELARHTGAISVTSPVQEEAPGERALPLSHYIWVLRRQRWRILLFIAASLLATFIVTRRLTPLYEAVATIDVDRQAPSAAVGQDARTSVIATGADADQYLATQMSLLRSDSVLRPVAEQLHLRDHDAQYAVTLKTPGGSEAPTVLKNLRITRPPNSYLLLVGYRSADPQFAASVANAIADSYLAHTYNIRVESAGRLGEYMTRQMDELRARMEDSSRRLAEFERDLNVVNPEEKTSIQSANLLEINRNLNEAREDRILKEAAWNSIRSGSMAAAFASTQADELKKLSETLDDARQKFSQEKLVHGEAHPEYRKAQARVKELEIQLEERREAIAQRVTAEYRQALDREALLRSQVEETRAEFDRLNLRSFDYQSLKEEAAADRQIYDELVRRIREAGINASFEGSAVRIADRARPPSVPVYPRLWLTLAVALLLSSLLGVSAAIAADILDNTIREPEDVSHSLRTEVVGSLPAVRHLRGRTMLNGTGRGNALVPQPAPMRDSTGYEEAIRTVRNSLLLTDFDRKLRSVLVTSASPSEGKSTVAAHLAVSHAEQKYRTLLIDGDLRRPSAHRFFGLGEGKGLAGVLEESLAWRDVVETTEHFPGLSVIPAGSPSRQAADLIGRRLPEILSEARQEYDLVILDSPPLIGFPEPLQMAVNVDGVLIVTRAGHTSRKAVAMVLATLGRLRARALGVVLNEVTREMSDSYSYYGYYTHYYRPKAIRS